jgi:hypothetical protein
MLSLEALDQATSCSGRHTECVLFQTNLPEKVDGTAATASEGANDESLYLKFFTTKLRFYIGYHGLFIGIWLQTAKFGSGCLRGVRQGPSRGSCKARMETKGCNTPTVRVGQEFQIVQGSTSTVESAKHRGPTRLLFVAVRKLHVRVRKRGIGGRELLKTDDRHVSRGTRPGAVLNELASDADRSCQQDPADNLFE